MTWAKFEGSFPFHPKITNLSDAAYRLHTSAIMYAAEHLTDGVITMRAARLLVGNRANKLAVVLVGAGVWECTDNETFVIHDFLRYNPSKADEEIKSATKSAAGKAGADARWGGNRLAPVIADAKAPAMPSAIAGAYSPTGRADRPAVPTVEKERSEPAAEVSRNGAAPSAASPAAAASASPGPPDGFVDCARAYDDLIGQPAVTPHIGRKIEAYLAGFHGSYPAQGVEWFRDACIEAATQNKRSLSYVTAILERWQREGRSGKRQRGETTASTLEEQRRKREYTRGSA